MVLNTLMKRASFLPYEWQNISSWAGNQFCPLHRQRWVLFWWIPAEGTDCFSPRHGCTVHLGVPNAEYCLGSPIAVKVGCIFCLRIQKWKPSFYVLKKRWQATGIFSTMSVAPWIIPNSSTLEGRVRSRWSWVGGTCTESSWDPENTLPFEAHAESLSPRACVISALVNPYRPAQGHHWPPAKLFLLLIPSHPATPSTTSSSLGTPLLIETPLPRYSFSKTFPRTRHWFISLSFEAP